METIFSVSDNLFVHVGCLFKWGNQNVFHFSTQPHSKIRRVFISVSVCVLLNLLHHTCICQHIWIAVLLVLQLQIVTELFAVFFYRCSQVCKLLRVPRVLQEEAERVATLHPVAGAVIPAEARQHPHGRVSIFSIEQVGRVWRTLLQSERGFNTKILKVMKKP